MKYNKIIAIIVSIFLVLALIASMFISGFASTVEELEREHANIENRLYSLNSKIEDLRYRISEYSGQIEEKEAKVNEIESEFQTLVEQENIQYQNMKARIKYMYERGYSSLIEIVFSASNLSDMISKAEYVESISEYDRNQITQLKKIKDKISKNRDSLNSELTALTEIKTSLNEDVIALRSETMSLYGDMSNIEAQIAAANSAASEQNAISQTNIDTIVDIIKPSQGYNYYPPGSGILNPVDGVVYFNGHRETYYSQRVLPGAGLNIPGRHIEADGTIRDGDGYICLASNDHPKGTIIQVSLGMGKVYDCGCPSGTIDVYTDW